MSTDDSQTQGLDTQVYHTGQDTAALPDHLVTPPEHLLEIPKYQVNLAYSLLMSTVEHFLW